MASKSRQAVREGRITWPSGEAMVEALTASVSECASRRLERMVSQAKDLFGQGRDPNEAYLEFDIGSLAGLLCMERNAAAEVLISYKDRPEDDRMAACVLVASALLSINQSDPHLARLELGEMLRAAKKDAGFSPMARLVLLCIADSATAMAESGEADTALVSLALSCMARLHRQ